MNSKEFFLTLSLTSKRELLEYKYGIMIPNPVINKTDIVPLINRAWDKSFANKEANKRAIMERGWYPYNRHLLLSPELRTTMSEEERNTESEKISIAPKSLKQMNQELAKYATHRKKFILPNYQGEDGDIMQLSFSSGMAADVLDKIVSNQDFIKSRERQRERRDVGKLKHEILTGAKKLSSGNLFLADVCCIGETAEMRVDKVIREQQEKTLSVYNSKCAAYHGMMEKANKVHADKSDMRTWNKKELVAVMRTYRRDPKQALNESMKRSELEQRFRLQLSAGVGPISLNEYLSIHNVEVPLGAESSMNGDISEEHTSSTGVNVENLPHVLGGNNSTESVRDDALGALLMLSGGQQSALI